MLLPRVVTATVVLASLVAGLGITERRVEAGCRGRRCTTTLCFDGGCCYSPPPYSNGNPYESGSGNFWGVNHYCRQYGFLHANRCASPCGPGNTPPIAGTVIAPQPSRMVVPPPPPPVEPKQPAPPPVPKPVE
jgi:hypothetical protein